MKKVLFLIVVVVLVYGLEFVRDQTGSIPGALPTGQNASQAIENAYRNKQGDIQIEGQGTVTRTLPDDLDGSRHQRIVLELDNGQSLLIAHNIDLAPRVPGLKKGDIVVFYGEYEWNSKGGVIHWTHKDPGRRHVDGWLKYRGKTYQ
jgi:hypothetical protein